MFVLSRKRIVLVLSMVFMSLLCFMINNTNTNEVAQTVALPVSNKVIVIDARSPENPMKEQKVQMELQKHKLI